jgi:hypothetical protein
MGGDGSPAGTGRNARQETRAMDTPTAPAQADARQAPGDPGENPEVTPYTHIAEHITFVYRGGPYINLYWRGDYEARPHETVAFAVIGIWTVTRHSLTKELFTAECMKWLDAGTRPPDDGWHTPGDICMKYQPSDGVMRADGTAARVGELEDLDVFRDPATDPEHQWWRITDVHQLSDGTVHLEFQDATCERCKQDPITDFDCGLCDDCTKYNADRVVL